MPVATMLARLASALAMAGVFCVPTMSRGADSESDGKVPGTQGQPGTAAAALRASALRASPIELAKRYVFGNLVLAQLKLVDAGATLQLPTGRVTRENVAQVRTEYRNRAWEYAAVIRERGFRDVHGAYRASVHPACARAQSAWVLALTALDVREVALRQDAFVVTIEQHGPTGETVGLTATAVIVESSLVFADPANSDYPLIGAVGDDAITLRPDVDAVLRGWPAWARPPLRETLAACVVVLAKGDGAAGGEALAAPVESAAASPERPAVPPIVASGPSAAGLARAYADVIARRKTAASLLSGEIVRLPEKPDARQGYEREKRELDAREAELAAVIRERGFAQLAGRYRATATSACKDAASAWAAAVSDGAIREVDLRQDGFAVTVADRGSRGSAASAIVVESTLLVPSPTGTRYPFVGTVEGGAVSLRPDLDSPLTRGTSIAGAQSMQALADCVVTLARFLP